MLVDLVQQPTAVQGVDAENLAHELDDELLDDNEVFAVLEINGTTELIYFNVNQKHAEENLADDLIAFFHRLRTSGDACNFQAIRIIIRFSPCLHVCAPKYLAAKQLADAAGFRIRWIIDFNYIYVGHEGSLDQLLDAGFHIPNYVVVQALNEFRSALVEVKRKVGSVSVLATRGTIDAGTQYLLTLAKTYFLTARQKLATAFDEMEQVEGMCLGYHGNIYQLARVRIERDLKQLLQAFVLYGGGGGNLQTLQLHAAQALQTIDTSLQSLRVPFHRVQY